MRTLHARLAIILSALLLAAPVASAQGPAPQVIDDVGYWSEAAKAKANRQIAEIKRLFNKDLVIEAAAAPKLPAGVDASNRRARDEFYGQWAQHRYEELRVQGVYLVVIPAATEFRYEIGRASQAGHYFSTDDGRALTGRLTPLFKANNPDAALAEATQFVESRMKENHAANAFGGAQPEHRGQAEHRGGGSAWGGLWTLVGFGIVAWIVFAVIRSISSMGRGGYPGASGGGGGGGFFSNMLGGLFGAAAGMYLYNSFFGHGNSAWGAGPGGGDYGSSSDPNAGDATATGGGGDYGDSGGDTGGGGDWGGGDAGGGGGDWGGGGGDFGGGGGDFGGGGGDW
jgi:hypothetical protein